MMINKLMMNKTHSHLCSALCDDEWRVILDYLDIKSLLQTTLSNQQLYKLFNTNEKSWDELIERDFSHMIPSTVLSCSFEQYKHLYSLYGGNPNVRDSSSSDRRKEIILVLGHKSEQIHLVNMMACGKWERYISRAAEERYTHEYIEQYNLKFACHTVVKLLPQKSVRFFHKYRATIVVLNSSDPNDKTSSLDSAVLAIGECAGCKKQRQDTTYPMILVLIEQEQNEWNSPHKSLDDVKQLCAEKMVDIIRVNKCNANKSLQSLLAFSTKANT
jgi:hypothetical protein